MPNCPNCDAPLGNEHCIGPGEYQCEVCGTYTDFGNHEPETTDDDENL